MIQYTPQQFKSVLTYIKEKASLSKQIAYRNGILAGIKIALSSEQAAYEQKAKAEATKQALLDKMAKLKEQVEPLFKSYRIQMKIARGEIDGNK